MWVLDRTVTIRRCTHNLRIVKFPGSAKTKKTAYPKHQEEEETSRKRSHKIRFIPRRGNQFAKHNIKIVTTEWALKYDMDHLVLHNA